jgi:PIN domain nuclease of toxin-antitoxin system
MNSIVLDSSAALAMLLGEPGGDRVMQAFLNQEDSIAMSAVNWSEVFNRLQRKSSTVTTGKLAAMLPRIEIVPFGQVEAERTALLAKSCGSLSLGDRACLTLAHSRGVAAWTTDRIWAQMPVQAKLEMIR